MESESELTERMDGILTLMAEYEAQLSNLQEQFRETGAQLEAYEVTEKLIAEAEAEAAESDENETQLQTESKPFLTGESK